VGNFILKNAWVVEIFSLVVEYFQNF